MIRNITLEVYGLFTFMKLTIKDIAARCGVGKSTVSRVLNQSPNVNPKTRERVQAVINELNFAPDRTARAMRGSAEKVIGIIVTRLNSSAESQTLSRILNELYAQNFTPLIVESQFKPERVVQELALFQQRQVDGVILFGFSELKEKHLKDWKKAMVTVARAYKPFSAVYYDDENAMKALLSHLYQQGHRQIGYLGIVDSDETTGKKRTAAYLSFCEQYQLTPYLAKGELSIESGYQQISSLMSFPFSILVCATTGLAVGAAKYLQENQKNLPLACIGQNPILQAFVPQLITLDFGYEQAGVTAVNLLLNQLENSETEIVHHKIPFKLI